MKIKNLFGLTFMTMCISIIFVASLSAQVNFTPPPGGWNYTYEGDYVDPNDNAALDGTWMHDNSSDKWAGDEIGDGGVPGGVTLLEDGDIVCLRIQDTGDPREYSFPDPSNRKISFFHFFDNDGVVSPETVLDDGITLAFRARVATGDPLDDVHPDGGAGIYPWPTEGNGYFVHDGGNGNFAVRQEFGGFIGFALAMKTDHEVLTTENKQGLVMNSSNGPDLSGAIKVGEGTLNILELEDPTAWHEFWINIVADITADGTHSVKIWVDGAAEPQEFAVTAGDAAAGAGTTTYLQMGMGNTAQDGAIDIDYVSYKEGVYEPVIANVEATGAEFPQESALYNNYPNPFNPTTEISFAMRHKDKVNIAVYNALGQRVETLLDGEKPAGIHTITFDSKLHSSGVYFYQMKVGDNVFKKKMLLLK